MLCEESEKRRCFGLKKANLLDIIEYIAWRRTLTS